MQLLEQLQISHGESSYLMQIGSETQSRDDLPVDERCSLSRLSKPQHG